MKCDIKKTYKMMVGDGNPIVYIKNHFKNFNERPVIYNARAASKTYANDIHFLLSKKGGLQICSKLMICVLGVQKAKVRNEKDQVVWTFG